MNANRQIFKSDLPFTLESGDVLPGIEIAYHTFGTLNADKSNVVWVCHALTASSDVMSWWPGVVGSGGIIDPSTHFIVCANILGSCYGSTGPLTLDTSKNEPSYLSFPLPTIRDIVNAFIRLRHYLGIDEIALLMGGSMGGYQVQEWAIAEPDVIKRLFLIATSPGESAWGQAIHAAQRMAIEADSTWQDKSAEAGTKGLQAARAIGMLTYRNYDIMVQRQRDTNPEKVSDFRAESYMRYQGKKLAERFNAQCYWLLTKSMDSHNLARGRGGELSTVLNGIMQPALIIGITSDILCPVAEQQFMAANMPNASYVQMESDFGHDGFLVEGAKISHELGQFLQH